MKTAEPLRGLQVDGERKDWQGWYGAPSTHRYQGEELLLEDGEKK